MNWAKHKAKWKACNRCDLCKDRFSVCLLRGSIPAQILFVGEAPGPCEDGSANYKNGIGKPFIGPAGDILQEIIDLHIKGRYTYALTNLVGCMPMDESKVKYTDPPDWAIKACAPRLKEVVRLTQPRLLFRVGTLARKNIYGEADFYEEGEEGLPWLQKYSGADKFLRFHDITHPGAIVKLNPVMRAIPLQRIEADIVSALGDWLNNDS